MKRAFIFFAAKLPSPLYVFRPLAISAVSQGYITETHNSHVILGNDALLKCQVPSFVSDFVSVSSWVSSQGDEYHLTGGKHGAAEKCLHLSY